MTGRNIGMVKGGSLSDPAIGVQCLGVAPRGVQHSGERGPVPVRVIGIEPHCLVGPFDALLRSPEITQQSASLGLRAMLLSE